MKHVSKNLALHLLVITLATLAVFGLSSRLTFAAGSGVVTITLDDGNPSQYRTAFPILKAGGQTATFYINSGFLGNNEWYMTWEQVGTLQRNGFEIAGHTLTHLELPPLNDTAKKNQINLDYQNFVLHGITPTNFAVPFGAYDNPTTALVAGRYNSLRAFANQGLNAWPYNKYLLYVHYITNQTSVEQVKAWVDEAMAKDQWLILVFHEILTTVDPTDEYSWETKKFISFVQYLGSKSIKAQTIAQVLGQYTNLTVNPSFESGLTNWTADNAQRVVLNTASLGNYPTPKNSIKMVGGATAVHLFGDKIPVSFGTTYGLRAYTDSRGLTTGEVGFYMDEYDQNGAWISGKWLGAVTDKNVIDRSYIYAPTSASVKTTAIQVYVTAATNGNVVVDTIELFAH